MQQNRSAQAFAACCKRTLTHFKEKGDPCLLSDFVSFCSNYVPIFQNFCHDLLPDFLQIWPMFQEYFGGVQNGTLIYRFFVCKIHPYSPYILHMCPGGFTLHMTGYAPACTKSVEKGSFLDIRRRRRLLQKGYIFCCLSQFRGIKWVELFRAENWIGKQHFENLCKIVKKHDMRFVFIWNIKENEVWHIRISSFSV